ncbi:MAG: response regulator, partial [Acidobacteriota bacterium]
MPHILVVEDDPDIAALIAHYLERAGHVVDRLASGAEVLPRLRVQPADLVILDLMLPGLNGLLICQAMRGDATTAGIPVIMLTARGEEADRVAGLEIGADDYVTKPFSPKELV